MNKLYLPIYLWMLLSCSFKEWLWLTKQVLDFSSERSYPGIYTVKAIKMLTFKLGFFLLV